MSAEQSIYRLHYPIEKIGGDASVESEATERLREASQNPVDAVRTLEWKHEVIVRKENNRYLYSLRGDTTKSTLFETAATEAGLKAGEVKLADLTKVRQAALEKRFGVAFSTSVDEVTEVIRGENCVDYPGYRIAARAPKLRELVAIESALEKSEPSHVSTDGQSSVKMYFLMGHMRRGGSNLARFILDKEGRPSLYFEPGATDASNLEPPMVAKSDSMDSTEAIAMHELVHNSQRNMGWDDPTKQAEVARDMGWLPFHDTRENKQKYILKGRDGLSFRYDQQDCESQFAWFRCDETGNPLNEAGTRVATIADAQQYKGEEVGEKALVKPATWYFRNPEEMHAEALTMFRLGKDHREHLLRTSPTLYQTVRREDQKEIDKHKGVDEQGRSKFVRDVSGSLVAVKYN